jgi:hypothetical protein
MNGVDEEKLFSMLEMIKNSLISIDDKISDVCEILDHIEENTIQ